MSSSIKILPQRLINQIAAGEVIERPASVIKELVENAIDAGSTDISVSIVDGGKNYICISDNGSGMDRDSLELCTLSHATSKLSSENLFDIHTFGFRGEALPSIASISRLSITTSNNDSQDAWQLQMEGQLAQNITPASRSKGTTIEVRDLFFATPARLKFLKSNSFETEKCRAIFDDLALANHKISFRFIDSNKEKVHYPKTDNIAERVKDIFGKLFFENLFEVDEKQIDGALSLHGYIGLPTFNRPTSNQQFFFVNGRLVKDRMLTSALKSAYAGLIPHGRYPVAILCLEMPYNAVDVNVHPAKTEVRFRNADQVRAVVALKLKAAIEAYGSSRSTTEMMSNFYSARSLETPEIVNSKSGIARNFDTIAQITPMHNKNAMQLKSPTFTAEKKEYTEKNDVIIPVEVTVSNSEKSDNILPFPNKNRLLSDLMQIEKENGLHGGSLASNTPSISMPCSEVNQEKSDSTDKNKHLRFGNALFQVNNTYIVAECDDGIIIVDQHAVAERIMLEELKKNLKISSQNLLIPEKLELSASKIELLQKYNDLLTKLGVYIEDAFPSSEVSVVAIPALLETSDALPLLQDILDELATFGDVYTLDEKIHKILSTMSCHSSLRAGKKLSIQEMNYLLRTMELTANIAQCCHGRPSYIQLSIKDLDKFFERT